MSARVLHCWKGKRDHMIEVHGFGSDEWAATYEDGGDGTCMLEAGHEGDHYFTPDEEIGVSFEPSQQWVLVGGEEQ